MAEAVAFAEAAKQTVETHKQVIMLFGKSLGLERYSATLEKLAKDLSQVNSALEEKDQKIGEELTTAQNLARRSLDAAVTCVLVIKTRVEPVQRVVDRAIADPNRVEKRLKQLIRKFVSLATESHTKLEEAKGLMNQAQDAFTSVATMLQSCIGSMERKSQQLQAELDAAVAHQNENYAWAAFGVLGGPLGLVISYSITTGVTEGLNKPALQAEFAKQLDIFNQYKQHFAHQQQEAQALNDGLHQKYDQLRHVDVQLQEAKTAAEDTLDEDWDSKEDRDILVEALEDFAVSLKQLHQLCVKFLSVNETEKKRVEAHKKSEGGLAGMLAMFQTQHEDVVAFLEGSHQ